MCGQSTYGEGQGRSGYLRVGVHIGGEKGQQGILSNIILHHENSSFSMDLLSTRNRLRMQIDDLGAEQAGLPINLSLRILQQHTLREKASVAAVVIRIHYSKMVTMLRADNPDMGDGHAATEAKLLQRFRELVTYCLAPRLAPGPVRVGALGSR